MFDTYKPEGFSTVNPYLFCAEPETLITFLAQAFSGVEVNRVLRPDGKTIANSIVEIGESRFMLSQAVPPFMGMSTAFYLYVSDVDAAYNNALKAGAESVFAAADTDFNDRQAGVKDPCGNYWWISQRLVQQDYD